MQTKLAGILNLTPDSFSDGGNYLDVQAMRAAVHSMAEAGADVIDVGAESTRPGAVLIDAETEWARLEPFAEVLPECRQRGLKVSVDTRHPTVAAKMLERGVDWINDVGGFADPAMLEAVRGSNCRLVVMHSLSIPADPEVTLPADQDVIGQLLDFAHARIRHLQAQEIAQERIIFDPGIGFGKTAAQSWEIVLRVGELHTLGVPLQVGHSRKSFLKQVADVPAVERDAPTLAVSGHLLREGVQYLRVHDVKSHALLIRTLQELQA